MGGGSATQHPAEWLRHTKAVDPKTGEEFFFHFHEGWEWQRDELTDFTEEQMILRLKARQLGVSWLGIGYCSWKCLTSPGTRALGHLRRGDGVLQAHQSRLGGDSPEHLRFSAEVMTSEGRAFDPDPVALPRWAHFLAARHAFIATSGTWRDSGDRVPR